MKIYRSYNGKKLAYTLSRAEMRKAYAEQQHLYDVEDIKNGIELEYEWYLDKFSIDEKPITEAEIEEMADKLRSFIDADVDSPWSACVRDAIKSILEKRD